MGRMVLVLMFLLLALTVGVFVASLRTRPDTGDLDGWAASHGLALDDRTRPMLASHLRTSKQLRWLGVLAGATLPGLVGAAIGISVSQFPPSWGWVFAGYLVGAVYAEVALVRRPDGERRTATLERRDLGDYLSSWHLRIQRALGLLLATAAVAIVVVPFRPEEEVDGRSTTAVVTAIAALAAIGLEVIERWLLARPQPYTDPWFVAADDAIRAQSLRTVAGSGIAVLVLALGSACWVLTASDVQVLRWTMWIPAFPAWVVALWSCTSHGRSQWLVRRRAPRVSA